MCIRDRIIADGEAGFGGPLNVFELAKKFIKAGAAGVHFEDQLASEKKCGHMGGKVLVPTGTMIKNLKAARLAADIADVPLIILAIGAIFAGILFKGLFIGHDISYDFWGNSIKFLEPLSTAHPPTWFLFLTPILVVFSIPISFYLFVKNKNIPHELSLIHI